MPTLLLFGGTGLLGSSVSHVFSQRGWTVVQPTRRHFDLADLTYRCKCMFKLFEQHQPNIVINAAAIGDLDQCERDPDSAEQVNFRFPELLASVTAVNRIPFFHVSTDQVFGNCPNDEGFSTIDNPDDARWQTQSVYGRTKRAGERAVLVSPYGYVLRVQWLYGQRRRTFVDSVVEAVRTSVNSRAMTKYMGVPTDVDDISRQLFAMEQGQHPAGIYHLIPGGPAVSRYELAEFVMSVIGARGPMTPVDDVHLPSWQAVRSMRSILKPSAATPLPTWQTSLRRYLHQHYLQQTSS